jgi:hypothetical protein
MPRHGRPLVLASAVRLVAQQRFEVARRGELAQAVAQQLGLPRQRGVVEVQVHHARRGGMLVYAQVAGQGALPDKSAAPGLAADQSHGLQLRIDAACRDECQALLRRELPVGGQAGARRQAPLADVKGECVDQLFVAGLGHAALYA